MNNQPKISYLIMSYVPHQLISINALIENYDVKIQAFSISERIKYIPEESENFKGELFKDYTKEEVYERIISFDTDILIVAGWMIKEYVWISKKIKKNTTIKVVAMSDTPWYGTIKQKLNSVISPFYLKHTFDYLWVAGYRQYDYARRLGFSNNQILFNSLTADNKLFHAVDIEHKKTQYPKNFIYVGRFAPEKGLNNLLDAWSGIENKMGWTLTLIGDGPLKEQFIHRKDVIIKDYMSHDLLLNEMQHAGCFVLPSLHEPWALVIHEAACAGLPIISTEVCGAAAHFVINRYNGYQVTDHNDLKNKMCKIINASDDTLITLSKNSRKLSHSIHPEICASSLIQILD